jgi:ribose transport system substrate-binding protein
MVAQGADAVVIIPDAGGPGTELAGIRSAHSRGVAIVPWGADPGGKAGKDYLEYVDGDHRQAGEVWATWMADQLPEGGKVAFFSGPPGNGPGRAELAGIKSVLADRPDIELVTGDDAWAVSNWDPAVGQKAAAALLSKNPDIKGVMSDEGLTTTGILRAFKAAGRPMPLVASLEANALACEFNKLKKSDDGIELATVGAMNFAGRYAAQLAIAKAAGVTIDRDEALSPEPMLPDPLFENSVDGLAPICDPDADESALLSNRITDEQLREMTRAGSYPDGIGK